MIGLRVPRRFETAAPVTAGERLAASATLAEALRSPAFWVFGLASSMYGLVASGIGLFNEAILAERGFEPGVYHTALAVTAITGLAGNVVGGAWAERGSFRPVLVSSMVMLSAALAGLRTWPRRCTSWRRPWSWAWRAGS